MFELSLRRADHIRRYSIVHANESGWEVRLEEDARLERRVLYQDWHRVERARALFEREVSELTERGWVVSQSTKQLAPSEDGLDLATRSRSPDWPADRDDGADLNPGS
jgi:hypothetical protein